MYCPKCKQTFDEGSRRFCPTDGARLISENEGGAAKREGIFANLIPKMDAISDLDNTLSDTGRFAVTDPNVQPPPEKATIDDELFFELDDDEPIGIMNEEAFSAALAPKAAAQTRVSEKPIPRKVNPYEISDGGVNLAAAERADVFTGDFDSSDPESFVGRMVKGRYKVTEFLGGDESGLAYLGDDKIVADKKVLVRILLDEGSDEIMDSILAEERISLSHLTHPNIARLIDSGAFTNGIQYLVSEYVDALSVRDILGIHGGVSETRAARVIRQAADALNQAHQDGILHRDMRPENLILETDGDAEQTKVVGFGASNGEPNELNTPYKAPEVLDGRLATAASDIFSLAVIGYEMLTGRRPFHGTTSKEIVRSQYAGLTLRATDVKPDLPRALDDVLEKAFAFNAGDRFVKARDFGEAFANSLTESARPAQVVSAKSTKQKVETSVPEMIAEGKQPEPPTEIKPAERDEPAWKNRSPEPPQVENSRNRTFAFAGITALIALLAFGWYYIVNNPPAEPGGANVAANTDSQPATIVSNTEMPPQPRNLPQPANTNYYSNSKQNLKGDLLLNFVGFTMYYPKDWKVNGPTPGTATGARGKFLDISRETPDGRMIEQMLISYYPSRGTFTEDSEKFPQLGKETNETLKKLLPGYQAVSEGEIKLNGDWRAYEVKFQGSGTSPTGEKLIVWGRRLFIPAARPGVRNGFEITMLATSLADDIKSVDDVGVKGQLAPILYSFEPSQNF